MDHLVMNFCRSIIIAGYGDMKSQDVGKNDFFLLFWKNEPLLEIFQNYVPKLFITTPMDMFCSNFVKFGPRKSVKSCVIYLTKILPGSPAFASAQITPKI